MAALRNPEVRIEAATGPFGALASRFIPREPNAAQQELLDFLDDSDQLGVRFSAAAGSEDIERATDLFLGSGLIAAGEHIAIQLGAALQAPG